MEGKIKECQTIAELLTLERQNVLNELEERLVFERKLEIFLRIKEWRLENERLGIVPDLTDTWTPEQRERFLRDWQDEEIPIHGQKRSYEEMNSDDEPQFGGGEERSYEEVNGGDESQVGRGEKRSHEEMTDSNKEQDEDDGAGTSNAFTVQSVKQVNVKKFKTTGMNYHVQFTNAFANVELSEYHGRLHEIFQSLLDEVIRGVPSHDQVRFVLHSSQLESPISFPFMPRQRLTTERVLAEFERVIQSNHDFHLNESVDVNIVHVEMPNGGKGTKRAEINLEKHLAKKRSIIRIRNNDELCLARALIVAKAKIDNDPQYKYIADHRKPMQTRLARELHQKASVPLGPCGLDEVKQFQTYLSDYQINIVSKEHQNALIFVGPEQQKKIYLYLHDNHYDVITTMPGFLARSMYCHTCKKAYDHQVEHICANICRCCRFPECPVLSWIRCNDCNRMFKSPACFDRHKQSLCASWAKCLECNKTMKRIQLPPEKHHCGMTKCSICKEYVRPGDHRCYMQPVEKRDEDLSESDELHEDVTEAGYDQMLFFDFECRQENGNHEPNLCVIQNEAGDEWVFEGDNTRNDFCEWLFQKERVNSVVMADNFQGYDSYFILQYLRENGVKYDVIMRGAKVLSLSVPMFKIKFIDSLNFIPMRLADFPKTFGIEELAKGYFPHLFNKKENENYVGPLPPAPYYNPNGMSPTAKEKFLQWHTNLKDANYVFNFREEILAYCRSDVDILRRCCMQFRELFRDVTEIDPFEKCLTIASACNLVYRTNYLEENTIAIISPHGYCPENKQSLLAQKWLSYTAESNEIYIQHARNGGEKRVGPYLLDGYHEETNTVYEVHGCFWHGKFVLQRIFFI
jgi:hypothetical protein